MISPPRVAARCQEEPAAVVVVVEVASGAGMMVVVVASFAEMLVAEMLEKSGAGKVVEGTGVVLQSGAGMVAFRAFEIAGMALRSGLSCCDRWFKKSGWMSP